MLVVLAFLMGFVLREVSTGLECFSPALILVALVLATVGSMVVTGLRAAVGAAVGATMGVTVGTAVGVIVTAPTGTKDGEEVGITAVVEPSETACETEETTVGAIAGVVDVVGVIDELEGCSFP